mgnify:CR=1 FL=1
MNHKHIKILSYTATLFLLILSTVALSISSGMNNENQNTITVTGEATVSAVPDVATFSFSVSEVADTPEDAQKIISKKVSTILDGLDDAGIAQKDIETNSYRINPKYEWVKTERTQQVAPDGTIYYPGNSNQQVLIGYDVSQNVSVTVRDLEVAPEVLTLLASTSVNNLHGPNFEIDNPEELKEEAREEAIDSARSKAKRLSRDLGVRLGDVVSFSENDGGYYPQPYYARAASLDFAEESFAPELPAGESEINSSVSITYIIK